MAEVMFEISLAEPIPPDIRIFVAGNHNDWGNDLTKGELTGTDTTLTGKVTFLEPGPYKILIVVPFGKRRDKFRATLMRSGLTLDGGSEPPKSVNVESWFLWARIATQEQKPTALKGFNNFWDGEQTITIS